MKIGFNFWYSREVLCKHCAEKEGYYQDTCGCWKKKEIDNNDTNIVSGFANTDGSTMTVATNKKKGKK